mmetsp:Transcript_98400/g.262992  ORF Transcript_98400/g.262992 Transcript_98400/m.262992 type:complete len:203 (+) Transcript_98400:252-860(+)
MHTNAHRQTETSRVGRGNCAVPAWLPRPLPGSDMLCAGIQYAQDGHQQQQHAFAAGPPAPSGGGRVCSERPTLRVQSRSRHKLVQEKRRLGTLVFKLLQKISKQGAPAVHPRSRECTKFLRVRESSAYSCMQLGTRGTNELLASTKNHVLPAPARPRTFTVFPFTVVVHCPGGTLRATLTRTSRLSSPACFMANSRRLPRTT